MLQRLIKQLYNSKLFYLSFSASFRPSVCLFFGLSVCLSIYLHICSSVCLSAYLLSDLLPVQDNWSQEKSGRENHCQSGKFPLYEVCNGLTWIVIAQTTQNCGHWHVICYMRLTLVFSWASFPITWNETCVQN